MTNKSSHRRIGSDVTRKLAAFIAAATVGVSPLAAQTPAARAPTTLAEALATIPEPSEATKLGDKLWLVRGALGSNVTVLVTTEGLILVDNKYEEHYEQLMKVIRSQISTAPVKYVINTHFHAYASGSNTKFRPAGADIISSIRSRSNTVDRVQPNAPKDLVPANITFEGEMRFHVGGEEIRIRSFGPGHTNSDVTVYFPRQRVICVGDLISVPGSASPTSSPPGPIDYNGGGSITGWIKNLDAIAAGGGFDKVVAGHGPGGNASDVLAYRGQLATLRAQIASYLRGGSRTEADLKRHLANELKWSELLIARGARGLYLDLRP